MTDKNVDQPSNSDADNNRRERELVEELAAQRNIPLSKIPLPLDFLDRIGVVRKPEPQVTPPSTLREYIAGQDRQVVERLSPIVESRMRDRIEQILNSSSGTNPDGSAPEDEALHDAGGPNEDDDSSYDERYLLGE